MVNSNGQHNCPECASKGRKVHGVTLQSLLISSAKDRLAQESVFLFCRTSDCSVVYFADDASTTFHEADLRVAVFQKSNSSQRFVCYCFEHSVQSIHDEVQQTGASLVADAIGKKCKQGLDNCETENPQGACCLGNVRQVTKSAQASLGLVKEVAQAPEAVADCCGCKGA